MGHVTLTTRILGVGLI